LPTEAVITPEPKDSPGWQSLSRCFDPGGEGEGESVSQLCLTLSLRGNNIELERTPGAAAVSGKTGVSGRGDSPGFPSTNAQ